MPHYTITISGHSVEAITEDSTQIAQMILDDTFVVTDLHIEEDNTEND